MRSTARSTSCASASTSSASPSRRSSARAATRSPSALPDVKNAAARRAAGRQGRPAVLLRLGDERPRARPQARPERRQRHRRPAGRRRSGGLVALRRGQARLQAPADPRRTTTRPTTSTTCSARPPPAQAHRAARRKPRPTCSPSCRASAGRRTPRSSRSTPARSSSRREKPDKAPKGTPDTYFVLNDNPALTGTDIKNPEQNFDQGAGGTGAPIVTFEFTDKGRKKWENVTREIAQRGQAQQVPGQSPGRVLPALRGRARRRAHHGAVHRLRRQPGRDRRAPRARRSRAASRSPRRRTWPSCSRRARCRSSSS